MKTEYLFPGAMVLLSFGAAFVYFYKQDYGRGFYWLLAGGLTSCLTWVIK